MNDLDLFSNSPSFNLTNHQHEPPIYSSTPLVVVEKPPSASTSSSFFLPLTENTQNTEQLIKLNEDLCLLGLFDFVPKIINIDQTVSVCRQLVKNYNKLSHDKHLLHENLKKYESEQIKYEKREDTTKHDIDCLQVTKERLSDDIQRYITKINQLTQIIQTKDKEIRRLNQIFNQQNALAKHQYRTLEKQMDKLKERIFNFEKNRPTPSTIDYSSPLLLNESIPSSSSSSLSSSEILLKKICHDYDQKHRLLMIENDQLRQCVINIYRQLEHLLLIHRKPTEKFIENNHNEESFETQLMYLPCDAVNEIVQRYFSKIYDQLDQYMLHEKPLQQFSTFPSENKDIKQQTSLHDHFLPS
ncbi:unnamed protein product [Rotaria sp. Silwood1]|nr:unnamed protein product [Rotaria sp. Silwood1]CAF1005656.1 unnamed protein product [Rotaria sp. Silwood1]CAF1014428.1 unnamed protein product [Rotaria sp. Silwood1]CAF3397475.1 unnamed protein product [Rotaria sp. Silwood1]CAF3421702.1 unnamed protein product [Rotaria sp. Silwood1]